MSSFIQMILLFSAFGGLVVAARKGYGYKQAIEQITFQFSQISKLKVSSDFRLNFLLTLTANNPTGQPINIDGIFLDIIIEQKGTKTTIAEIRELDFNKSIKAKANTPIPLNIGVNLSSGGIKIIDKVISFFKGEETMNKNIFAIGNITAEGIQIPVNESLESLAK